MTVVAADDQSMDPITAIPCKRILILMSDTGGGHRASAKAIAAALDKAMPGQLDITILDVLTEFGVWPLGNAVDDYKTLLKCPNLYGFAYDFIKLRLICSIVTFLAKLTNVQRFCKCFELHRPDLVVSVHPLLQPICIQALELMGGGKRRIPFLTVVTDLCSGFPTWFHPLVDLCIVPSQELYAEAKSLGIKDETLRLRGLPVRQEFWSSAPEKKALRKRLGLDVDRKMVLVMSGGDGFGTLVHLTREIHGRLCQALPQDSQVVVICGSNVQVRTQLEATSWSQVPVRVEGYTTLIADFMGAADLLVTKAGPGTITEACLRGLPCILSGFIPGQEAGNVKFVEEQGFGVLITDAAKIAQTAADWLSDEDRLRALADKARAAGQPEATMNIALDILAFLTPAPPPEEIPDRSTVGAPVAAVEAPEPPPVVGTPAA